MVKALDYLLYGDIIAAAITGFISVVYIATMIKVFISIVKLKKDE